MVDFINLIDNLLNLKKKKKERDKYENLLIFTIFSLCEHIKKKKNHS